ncbi:uncharacterized protein LOC127526691 [Erpetoichthys calabaricus]|uniref:uncharacterized protein LOC127526691 n=1 Tax=Erpetoichthys calabaricus TaxID=27687 RepID=UPI00223465C6|nr:uncharacterized protein LOC127526691 [Erpetoichthys calabaricus]
MEEEQMLLLQYNIDFPERSCEEKEEMSQKNIKFMCIASDTASLVNGHYCINLPFRDETLKVPNNRCVAEQRAIGIKRKLTKYPTFHEDYKIFMKDILDTAYAIKVPTEQQTLEKERVWYIPHHGAYHPKKNKIRVVFDCTATYQGFPLNEQLLKGPDLTNTLIGVLTRFRDEPIALMADIKSMFYQVKVPDEDTDLLCFLWWPEGNLNNGLEEYKMTVHLFGATSLPSCASYALRRTAEDARDTAPEEADNTVLHNFYVDDCLKSVDTEEQAIKLAKGLQALCLKGGFYLTKWISNSRTVLLSIPEEDRAIDQKDLDLNHDLLPVERDLGVQWCTQTDSFKFQVKLQDKPATRHGILSVVSSIYDPLGFLAPVILLAKLILRELCKEKYAWNKDFKEVLMHLKEERKAIQYTVSQSGHSPERQKTLITEHMKEYKSTMRLKPLSLNDLFKAEDELLRLSQL